MEPLCPLSSRTCVLLALLTLPCTALLLADVVIDQTQYRLQGGPVMAVMRKMADAYREKPLIKAIRNGKQVCYEDLGCFSKMPPLKKAPQSPTDLDTKFFLYTRMSRPQEHRPGQQQWHDGFQETEIRYDDGGKSLAGSGLDPRLPTRIVVHGFKGSLKDEGAVSLVDNLLKIEDSNVIVVDWEKGAQGPSYIVSAANTQLIGRQLALLIMDAINMGVPPEMIHVIGFSLGAHIAGYAGRAVRQAMDVQLGRITGLDPASPLFREFLKASLISLNVEDARIVDVIHTDGAPRWPSGFGLWKVIGDVDFFPNGGRDQPGCTHVPASLIVSHFEGVVNSSIVCNHARGFQLFLESTIPLKVERSVGGVGAPCRFRSFPCHSRDHFGSGACFPYTCNLNATDGSCSVMGMEAANRSARGPMYLVTRDMPPYCGDQLQGSVLIGRRTGRARGTMTMRIVHRENETTLFALHHHSREPIRGGGMLRSLSAAKYGATSGARMVRVELGWRSRPRQDANAASQQPSRQWRPTRRHTPVFVEAVQIADMDSNQWTWCSTDWSGMKLAEVDGSGWETAVIELTTQPKYCSNVFFDHQTS